MKTKVTGPMSVTCPTIGCAAKPGSKCLDYDRMLGAVERSTPHPARLVEALPDTSKLKQAKARLRIANNPHSLPRGY